MRILALIPARSGSKGVPGKNIKLLGNKPLLQYSIDAALASNCFEKILVSTDSPEIQNIAKNCGAEAPFLRPLEFASDGSPTIDVVIHAINELKENNEVFDAVCLLQPTVPFRDLKNLQQAVKVFSESETDSLVTVRLIPDKFHPDWVYVNDDSGHVKLFSGEPQPISRRQNLSKAFIRDGSVYICKTNVILEQRSLYGASIHPFEMSNSPNINIDTFEDWEKAESYLQNRHNS